LKEKGFNEQCRDFYRQENENWLHRNTYEYNYFNLQMPRWEDCYACPTLQMVMKWLREVHNINIDIVSVWNQKRFEYQVFIVTPENAKHCYVDEKLYLSYEEAAEAGIKYCLDNLI
jgi:hypothetical protein